MDRWSMIMDHGLERRFGSVMWIGDDGDQCWWRLVLMEIGVDGVLVMGWRRRGKKKILKKKKIWRRKRGGDRDKDGVKKKGVYSEEKEGWGGGRWEIIKKARENIILIKMCV